MGNQSLKTNFVSFLILKVCSKSWEQTKYTQARRKRSIGHENRIFYKNIRCKVNENKSPVNATKCIVRPNSILNCNNGTKV